MQKLLNSDNTFTHDGYQSIALLKALKLFNEGTVCVWREFEGKPAVLKLEQQNRFKEFNGCFSLYNYARG